jgi:rubrerythrin
MRQGFAKVLEILNYNLDLEKNALRRYREFAENVKDKSLKDFFINLAKAESGHINAIGNVIRTIIEKTFEVSFFCPVCGWRINFGKDPKAGDVTRCRMCGVSFELTEENGDFDFKRI